MYKSELSVKEFFCIDDQLIFRFKEEGKLSEIYKINNSEIIQLQIEELEIASTLEESMDWYIKGELKEQQNDNKYRLRSLIAIDEVENKINKKKNQQRLKLLYSHTMKMYFLLDPVTQSAFKSKEMPNILNLINQIQECQRFSYKQYTNKNGMYQYVTICDNKLTNNYNHISEENNKKFLSSLGINYKIAILEENNIYVYNKEKICNLKEQCFYIDNMYWIHSVGPINKEKFEIYLTKREEQKQTLSIKYFIYLPYYIFQSKFYTNDCVICQNIKSYSCVNDCLHQSNNAIVGYFHQIIQYVSYTLISIIIFSVIGITFLCKKDQQYFEDVLSNTTLPKPHTIINAPRLELTTFKSEIEYLTS